MGLLSWLFGDKDSKKKDKKEVNQQLSMVLMGPGDVPTDEALQASLDTIFKGRVKIAPKDEKEEQDETEDDGEGSGVGLWKLDIPGNGFAMLMLMPVPVPNDEAANAADGHPFFENGPEEVKKHTRNLVVTSMMPAGMSSKAEAVVFHTQLCCALVEAFDAIAVYWGSGVITHSAEFFLEAGQKASPSNLPLMLWIRFQPYMEEGSDRWGLYTLGLEQFDQLEIEIPSSSLQPGELLEWAFNCAAYLIDGDVAMKNGDRVDGDKKVFIKKSFVDEDRKAYQIQMP